MTIATRNPLVLTRRFSAPFRVFDSVANGCAVGATQQIGGLP
jgi:hypothetical protein